MREGRWNYEVRNDRIEDIGERGEKEGIERQVRPIMNLQRWTDRRQREGRVRDMERNAASCTAKNQDPNNSNLPHVH